MTPDVRENIGVCEGVGGLRLRTRSWEIERPACAVLVVHGHGEHSGRYAGIAARLAARGCSVFAYDHRGHGASEGRRGHARSLEVLLQDLDRIRHQVEALAGALPLVILGQSMGGLLALRYVQEFGPRAAGLVLVSPWLGTAMDVPRWKTLAAPLLSSMLPTLPFHTRLDPDGLSRDATVVAAYRADPLVHDVMTPRLFVAISGAMGQAFARAGALRTPVLVVLGEADPVVDTARAAAFARTLPRAEVALLEYAGLRHEPLQEPERARVVRDIADWIDARLGEVPNRQR